MVNGQLHALAALVKKKEEKTLVKPQSRYEHRGRKEYILALQDIELRILDFSVCSLITIVTELSRLVFSIWKPNENLIYLK
jgi:hypothetical protein